MAMYVSHLDLRVTVFIVQFITHMMPKRLVLMNTAE